MIVESLYLKPLYSFESRARIVEKFGELVQDVAFDAIVVSGTSGLILGGLLAQQYKKNLIVVRKNGHTTHTSRLIEGAFVPDETNRCVFVDDFVDSGATVERVFRAIKDSGSDILWVGCFFWNSTIDKSRLRRGGIDLQIPELHFKCGDRYVPEEYSCKMNWPQKYSMEETPVPPVEF